MTVDDAKIFGIIGGLVVSAVALLLNFYSTMRNARAQRISNYQEIIKSHRELWRLTLQDPETYKRVFEADVDIVTAPITHEERLFSQLLFLHMTSAYTYSKYNQLHPIEKLELDFSEALLDPIPRIVWQENRKYFNSDFVKFLELANRQKGIKGMISRISSLRELDYTKQWNVLLLTAFPEELSKEIERLGDKAFCASDIDDEITRQYIRENKIDFIVCFGYGRILNKNVYSHTVSINVHGGFLPYNRGPNPNLWAWINGTKKGVSIHYIDGGIDTGDLIAQREISFTEPVTLQSAFDKTLEECKLLFKQEWPKIREGTASRFKQVGEGTVHALREQDAIDELLDDEGFNMPIEDFCTAARSILGNKA